MLLHEKLAPYTLILASRSPRRRQLIADCGLCYTLAPDYEVEECYPNTLPAAEVAGYLAALKSSAYPTPLREKEILITADTVVILGNWVIGKPTDRAEAISTLEHLSGGAHEVITGVTLRSSIRTLSFSVSSKVFFRTLTAEEISYYIDTYHPYDKAGAYGIQEWIGYVAIERIEGSFYNVMGLPIQRLYDALGGFI